MYAHVHAYDRYINIVSFFSQGPPYRYFKLNFYGHDMTLITTGDKIEISWEIMVVNNPRVERSKSKSVGGASV